MAKIAQYHIIKQLGSGHFGTVYLGFGVTPAKGSIPEKKRIVAIKQLKDGASRRSISQLKREFSLLDQVKHRCLPSVYEFIESKNSIVMEFFHGVTLRDVLDDLHEKNQQVFSEAATEIACEIADALYQVYTTPGDNGEPLELVHRDLKPANIILTSSGEIKILDFGLARVNNTEFTTETSTHVKGTPIYMAPEQALGQGEEHRTDLYTLGLMLYELLMGKPAYRIPENSADPIKEIFRDISAGTFDFSFSELQQNLPILGKTLTKMLQKRKQDRHNNGQELLIELRRILNKSQGTYISEFAEYYFNHIHSLPPAPNFDELSQKFSSSAFPKKMSQPNTPNKQTRTEPQKQNQSPTSSSKTSSVRNQISNTLGNRNRPIRTTIANTSQTVLQNNTKQPNKNFQQQTSSLVTTEEKMAKSKRPPRPQSNVFQSSSGIKSPNDPGMLSTVPLCDEESDDSATQFFARPAPKAATPIPPPSRPPSGNFNQNAFQQSSSFPSPHLTPNAPKPNVNPARQMGGIGNGGIGNGGIGNGGIGNGGIGNGGIGGNQMSSPVAVASTSHSSAEPMEGSGRTGSQRVWILLLCAFLTFVLCCIIIVYVFFFSKEEEVAQITQVQEARVERKNIAPVYEEEEEEIIEIVEEKTQPVKRKKAPKTTPKPKVKVAGANLNVTVNGASVTQLELKCPSKRYRAKVNGKMGNFTDLPGESCELFFKPTPAKYGPFVPSGNISCNITGGGAAVNCK